jgi:hypothetical protein
MEAPGRCGIRSIGDAPDRKRSAVLSAKAEFQTHLRCRTGTPHLRRGRLSRCALSGLEFVQFL